MSWEQKEKNTEIIKQVGFPLLELCVFVSLALQLIFPFHQTSIHNHPSLKVLVLFSLKERHKALEEMGISIQSSGIAVEKNKFYLVNLNADPSLNELLVYYLKVR